MVLRDAMERIPTSDWEADGMLQGKPRSRRKQCWRVDVGGVARLKVRREEELVDGRWLAAGHVADLGRQKCSVFVIPIDK